MSHITLDADAFRALSSDTRLQIMKALDARRLTVSELSRALDLNKATVFEHLKQLAQADLVKKEDEGRKWVYYKLTWKGKKVLHPEDVQFMLLLATATVSAAGFVAALGQSLAWWGASSFAPSEPQTTTPSDEGSSNLDPQAAESDAGGSGGSQQEPTSSSSAPQTTAQDSTSLTGAGDGAPPPEPETSSGFFESSENWLLLAIGTLLAVTLFVAGLTLWQRHVDRKQWRTRIDAALTANPAPPGSSS